MRYWHLPCCIHICFVGFVTWPVRFDCLLLSWLLCSQLRCVWTSSISCSKSSRESHPLSCLCWNRIAHHGRWLSHGLCNFWGNLRFIGLWWRCHHQWVWLRCIPRRFVTCLHNYSLASQGNQRQTSHDRILTDFCCKWCSMPQWLRQRVYSECNLRMVWEWKGFWRLCSTQLAWGVDGNCLHESHSMALYSSCGCSCCGINLWLHHIHGDRTSTCRGCSDTFPWLLLGTILLLVLPQSFIDHLFVWSLGLSSSRRLGPCDDISHFLSVLCRLCGRPDHHQPCMFSQLLDHSGLVYFHNLCDCLFGTQAQLCRKKPGNWESGGQSLKVWSFTPWRIGCFVGSFAKAFKTSCKCMMTCHQLAAVSMQTWNQLEPAPLNVCILQSSKGSKSSSRMPAHRNDASYLDPYTVDAPHDAPYAFGSSYQYPQDKKWWYDIHMIFIWYTEVGLLTALLLLIGCGDRSHEAGGLGLYGVVLRNLLPDHFGRKLEWNKKFQKLSQKSLNV